MRNGASRGRIDRMVRRSGRGMPIMTTPRPWPRFVLFGPTVRNSDRAIRTGTTCLMFPLRDR